ncbi:hypothetical protein AAFN85_11925 [Mucilaginibacter sp. CAU 1740]|uniref:hypothetical protein n=1 Tax=Mucilaginibacter sp. CAU 1740 TaxID=3140365 RepID=UPI00325B344C
MKPKFTSLLSYNTLVITVMVLCFPLVSFSQTLKPGSLAYLKQANGIGGFRLGSYLTLSQSQDLSYIDGENGKPDADSCVTYEYHIENGLKVEGGLNINHVCLRTYKNKLVNIYVFFNRKEGYLVLRRFLQWYGTFTAKPNDYLDIYDWDSNKVKVSLRYHLDTDQGMAVYTCVDLMNEVEARKVKPLPMLLTASQ